MRNNDFEIGKVLGEGAYSTVYKCKLKNFEKEFALKIIKAD